jgi:hypothetical protein
MIGIVTDGHANGQVEWYQHLLRQGKSEAQAFTAQ